MKKKLALGALLFSLSTVVQAEPVLSKLDCKQQGDKPTYDCIFSLADDDTGAPVTNAVFSIKTTMPTMPMAHNAHPVNAKMGNSPGTYYARLPLDMYGVWRLDLTLTKPLPSHLYRTVEFRP